MADYIQNPILCEAYIYIPDYDLTPEREQRIRHILDDYLSQRKGYFFPTETQISIQVEEGSLKLRGKVLGGLAAALVFYGDLREGVTKLYEDGHRLAQALAVEGIFASGARAQEVGRIEVRTGIPGSIRRLIAEIDALEHQCASMKPDALQAAIAKLHKDADRIMAALEEEADQKAIAAGLLEILEEAFPRKLPAKPTEHSLRLYAIRNREDMDQLRSYLKSLV